MSRLTETFAAARAENRAALIGYLPAWYPSPTDCVPVIAAMIENGVDIVEVGLPYSDPLLDGPAIQAAVTKALGAGVRIVDVLDTVRGVAGTGVPTLVMSYWNPILSWGSGRFATELAAAGGVGVITPDLPPEAAAQWCEQTEAAELDRVFLVAPASTDERIEKICQVSSGFVYAASIMGVTGARESVSDTARILVDRVRVATSLPVCVGLGVSTGSQAAQVAAYADGVIVGSAFVNALERAASPSAGAVAVAALAAELAAGVRQ